MTTSLQRASRRLAEVDLASYVGVPFLDKGRSIEGADCWGLVRIVYRELLGLELPSFTEDYASRFELEEISRVMREEASRWESIPPGREALLDVAGFWVWKPGKMTHVGIVAGGGRMLHLPAPFRDGSYTTSAVESYRHRVWRGRLMGFFRPRP